MKSCACNITFRTNQPSTRDKLGPDCVTLFVSRIGTSRLILISEADLQVPLFKTANGQNSFAYRGAQLWNSIESEVKNAPFVLVFKHRFSYFSFPMLIFCYFRCVFKAFTFIVHIYIIL